MTTRDHRGDRITGASDQALTGYESALHQFQCFIDNPFEPLEQAIQAAPGFAMAHILKAHLFLSGTDASGVAPAEEALAAARAIRLNEREALHVAAAEALIAGEFERAEARFEDILTSHPRDILALQMAHAYDFFRGDARNLRDRVARVMHAWVPEDPGYHALLGMHAFGLEECGEYGRAEEQGCRAVALEPKDTWAHHAVAHVLEMQGRRDEGIKWMSSREQHWAGPGFLVVHNWWHLALYHLDQENSAETLRLYDTRIRGTRSNVILEMIDASAMLWRLMLRGIDVGDRWKPLAEDWAPFAEQGIYAFNDVHALMSFVGAGDAMLAEKTLASMRRAAAGKGSNVAMTRDVGLPVALALKAFGDGRYGETVDKLRDIRPVANRFGGSHAQRDLIDLTLIEAARRAGQKALLRNLVAERLAAKPHPSALALRYKEAA